MSRSSRNSEEFIFWHAVGCSRSSTNVNNLMRRLIKDLKIKFELTREVSLTVERLSWELPRFLDSASKRGKVIIIIDGLNRLISREGEAELNWLPLVFPPNVRVILSASMSSSQVSSDASPSPGGTGITVLTDSSPKKPRILVELDRRHWQVHEGYGTILLYFSSI